MATNVRTVKPLDGVIQFKSTTQVETDSSSGTPGRAFTVDYESDNVKFSVTQKRSLLWQIITFPLTVFLFFGSQLIELPTTLRNVFEYFFFVLQARFIPYISEYLAYPFNVTIPAILSSKILTFFVPYGIVKLLIANFGCERQMITGEVGSDELERVTEKLARVSVEKNELLDVSIQNRKLQQENESLRQRVKAFESNKPAVSGKESDHLQRKLQDFDANMQRTLVDLKAAKEEIENLQKRRQVADETIKRVMADLKAAKDELKNKDAQINLARNDTEEARQIAASCQANVKCQDESTHQAALQQEIERIQADFLNQQTAIINETRQKMQQDLEIEINALKEETSHITEEKGRLEEELAAAHGQLEEVQHMSAGLQEEVARLSAALQMKEANVGSPTQDELERSDQCFEQEACERSGLEDGELNESRQEHEFQQ